MVLVHPAARRHRQRRRRRAVRLPVQGPRRARSRPTTKKSSAARRSRRASRTPRGRPATSPPRTTPIARSRSPATAGCWSATRSGSSIRSTRPACCWRSGRASWPPTPSSKVSTKGDLSAAQLGKWGPDVQRGRRSHAAAGVRVLRRLQLRQLRARHYPELRGTVTDLLIGDLFTDAWTKCGSRWSRCIPTGKTPIPAGTPGRPPERSAEQGERAVPAGGQKTVTGAESLVLYARLERHRHLFYQPRNVRDALRRGARQSGRHALRAGPVRGVVTGAADGYYRMSGKPASTLLHLGPRPGQRPRESSQRAEGRSAIVNIVGDHATYHRAHNAPLTADIEGIARPVSNWVKRAGREEPRTRLRTRHPRCDVRRPDRSRR